MRHISSCFAPIHLLVISMLTRESFAYVIDRDRSNDRPISERLARIQRVSSVYDLLSTGRIEAQRGGVVPSTAAERIEEGARRREGLQLSPSEHQLMKQMEQVARRKQFDNLDTDNTVKPSLVQRLLTAHYPGRARVIRPYYTRRPVPASTAACTGDRPPSPDCIAPPPSTGLVMIKQGGEGGDDDDWSHFNSRTPGRVMVDDLAAGERTRNNVMKRGEYLKVGRVPTSGKFVEFSSFRQRNDLLPFGMSSSKDGGLLTSSVGLRDRMVPMSDRLRDGVHRDTSTRFDRLARNGGLRVISRRTPGNTMSRRGDAFVSQLAELLNNFKSREDGALPPLQSLRFG